MLEQLDDYEPELIETDVCVVGAGAAGIAIATEWIGKKHNVVLLESGGFGMDRKNQALYQGENVGIPYFPLTACRLRMFGGSTGHWGGACWPIEPEVFSHREWISEDAWPITRDELDPYYIRGHKILGLGPFDYSPEYWSEASHMPVMDLGDQLKTKLYQSSEPILRFGPNYRGNVLKARNISGFLGANLSLIKLKDDLATVDYVEATSFNQKRLKVVAKHYVLACGGVENPRQLLLNNKQQVNGIGNQHDLVGRYFMEHLFLRNSLAVWSNNVDMSFYKGSIAERIRFRGGIGFSPQVEKEQELLNTWFSVNVNWDPPYPAIEGMQASLHKERDKDPALLDEMQSFISSGAKPVASDQPAYTTLTCIAEQTPSYNSRVLLDQKQEDELGQYRANLDWRVEKSDQQKIIKAHHLLSTEMGKSGKGRLRVDIDEENVDWSSIESIKQQGDIYGSYHHMGTTRMSDNPKRGVVDKNCKVHGCNNLYVAGSSVFPTAGFVNPTLTICALAFRLADYIDNQLNSVSISDS